MCDLCYFFTAVPFSFLCIVVMCLNKKTYMASGAFMIQNESFALTININLLSAC